MDAYNIIDREEAMYTKLIDGVPPLPEDEELLVTLKKKLNRYSGPGYMLGICNAEGKVYRVIGVEGLNGVVTADTVFRSLGFRDAWFGKMGLYRGLSSVFARSSGPAECCP